MSAEAADSADSAVEGGAVAGSAEQLAPATEAYLWGYPLVVMHRTRALLSSRTPLGTMNHRDELATARDRAVVAPNNDTLYSSGWFDLSAGDLIVDVPPMDHPERYWSVMLLDAYTNVAYACRRLHGVDGASVKVVLDPHTEPSRKASDALTMATPTVWVLVRVLVDGPEDLDAARALQRSITVHAPPEHPAGLTERAGRPNEVHKAGAAFFDELRAALAVDASATWHPAPSPAALAVIRGEAAMTEDDLVAAVEAGEAVMRERGFGADCLRNGWGTRRGGTDFGDDIVTRASTAKFALAGHHPVENRSYTASVDSGGSPLDGTNPLALRFPPGGSPPCDGFWSLTVYEPDMYFYDNEIDRYAIGDRTEGLSRDDDGGLTIVIGGDRPADHSNWLPAPPGRYALGLRVYEGRGDVVDAKWFPPALTAAAVGGEDETEAARADHP